MNVRTSFNYWSRADAPARASLLAALAGLQVGQRLSVADFTRSLPAVQAEGEGAVEGERADAAPGLVEYVTPVLRAGGVDPDTRECEFSFSSEEPYERWWGVEILGHDIDEVDLSWLNSGRAPYLADHLTDIQIGVIKRAWVARDRKGRVVTRFGRSERAEEEMRDVADGTRLNVSVGYEILELELIKQEGELRFYRVTRWRPLEVSNVALPADMTVGHGRSASTPLLPVQPRIPEQTTMTQEKHEGAATGDAMFKQNVDIITRLATTYAPHLKADDAAKAIAAGADPQKFNELIMERLQSGATDATTSVSLGLTQKEAKKFSLLRAVQSQLPGARVDAGFEREVSNAIAQQCGREAEGIFVPEDLFASASSRAQAQRDFTAGTAGEAGNLVATNLMASMFTDVLRPALILGRMGITILPGLRSNVAIPRKTVAGTLAMLTEIAAASETQPTIAQATMSPKRVSAFVEPSKQAIIQSELGIEAMLTDDLLSGNAVLLENQGINGSGSSPNARGIRNVSGIGSVVGGANGLAFAWAHTTGLEAACANANAGMTERAGYLLNTKVVNTTKNTQKAANLPFIWDGGDRPLNGYRAGISNNVPSNLTKGTSSGVCSSVIFSSDWSMFVLGLFGGLDITVDPYSLATTGQVRITLNQFFDWVCRQPGAFSCMDDALTP